MSAEVWYTVRTATGDTIAELRFDTPATARIWRNKNSPSKKVFRETSRVLREQISGEEFLRLLAEGGLRMDGELEDEMAGDEQEAAQPMRRFRVKLGVDFPGGDSLTEDVIEAASMEEALREAEVMREDHANDCCPSWVRVEEIDS